MSERPTLLRVERNPTGDYAVTFGTREGAEIKIVVAPGGDEWDLLRVARDELHRVSSEIAASGSSEPDPGPSASPSGRLRVVPPSREGD